MQSWLARLFRPTAAPAPARVATALTGTPSAPKGILAQDRALNASAVVYPPQDPGLPLVPVETLLFDQAELLGMLRVHAAESPEQLQLRFMGPIERLAAHINILPATSHSVFSGAGGLFRASLETAFRSFRGADGRIFTGEHGVEQRHRLESRWRYVCFLAGLLYPVGSSLAGMLVTEQNRQWSPQLDALLDWQPEPGRIYVTWTAPDAQPGPAPLAALIALRIAGRENVEWLNAGSPSLIAALTDIVSGTQGATHSIAGDLVRHMWATVREQEVARRPQNYGKLTVGSDVAPYLLDAMVANWGKAWRLNESIAYADTTGLYLQWPAAGQQMLAYCADSGFAGIPSTEAGLLSVMVSNGIVSPGGAGLGLVQIADSNGEIVPAVKLARPALLLGADLPLETFATGRKVLLDAIRADDPLAAAEAGKATEKTAAAPALKKAPPVLNVITPSEVLGESGDDAASEDEDSDEERTDEPGATAAAPPVAPTNDVTTAPPVPPAPPARPRKASAGGRLEEGAEIKFSDLLPQEVSESMPAYYAEMLGRIVHVWRTRDMPVKVMRMCEFGAAVDLDLLKQFTEDVPAFLAALGERGHIYTHSSTPGKLIYPIAEREGSKSKHTCFILAMHTVRKLGLQ